MSQQRHQDLGYSLRVIVVSQLLFFIFFFSPFPSAFPVDPISLTPSIETAKVNYDCGQKITQGLDNEENEWRERALAAEEKISNTDCLSGSNQGKVGDELKQPWIPTGSDPGGFKLMHDHEEAFHYTNDLRVTPKILEVFGKDALGNGGLIGLFAKELAEPIVQKHLEFETTSSTANAVPLLILSVGAGNCQVEITIAKEVALLYPWIQPHVTCYDPIEVAVESARETIANLKPNETTSSFLATQTLEPGKTYDSVFAHHSLHHFTDLPALFGYIATSLQQNGVFVFSDMISRNGHSRWPEQRALAEKLFDMLPLAKRYDHILQKTIESYPDYDYTCNRTHFANEGINSQTILPLLIHQDGLNFSKFVAFGGVLFEFQGHRLAGNFVPSVDRFDKAFLTLAVELEEQALLAGSISPDQVIAVMHKGRRLPKEKLSVWKNLTPEHCVRTPLPTDIYKASPSCG